MLALSRVRLVPALFGLSLLAACPPGEPAKDAPADSGDTADTGGPDCDPVDPVVVTVTNDRGWYVSDTVVSWSAGEASGECEARTYDRWRCEVPAEGDLVITASHPLHVEQSVTVEATDGCRDTSEEVSFSLAAAGDHFEASRMYYQRLFADDYECEHSWELYGRGCYYTAAFCADGYSAVMVTDILNSGVYDVGEEGRVGNVLMGIGDLPEETTWTLRSATEITDWTGATWTLDTEGLFDLYDCNE